MPVREVDSCPPQLFHPDDKICSVRQITESGTGKWCIAVAKWRCERALANELVQLGIPYYMPYTPKWVRSGNHKVQGVQITFAPYIFFYGSKEVWWRVLDLKHTAHLVEVTNQKQFSQELAWIEMCMHHDYVDRLEDSQLKAGVKVNIIAGPLMGISGEIEKIDVEKQSGRIRLHLKVTMLGRSIAASVDRQIVEVISQHDYPGFLLTTGTQV